MGGQMNSDTLQTHVYSQKEGRITSVVLNRPQKLNALTSTMIAAVRDALEAAQQDPETHVLMLRGNGSAFCAGDDVAELAGAAAMPDEQILLVATLQDVTRQIMLGPKPVVAVVQGWAVGAAFSWLLNCDLAVCAESAKAFFPEVKWGVSPTGAATVLVPGLLGAGRARESFLLSRRWTAQELFGFGAVARVVADGRELSEAMLLARELADLPPHAVSGVKRLINKAISGDLESVLQDEAALAVATVTRREVAGRLAARTSD
jgi:enoyl-CoA hydratase/carnithine racemase